VGRGQDFSGSHALHPLPERVTVDAIAITEEVRRRGVVREGVHDLLGRPDGGGIFRHVEGENTPSMEGEDDEDEENAQARGWERLKRSMEIDAARRYVPDSSLTESPRRILPPRNTDA
jgi:hypothetical protein